VQRKKTIVLMVVAGLGVLFTLGPRTPVEEPTGPADRATASGQMPMPSALAELPAWLAATEAAAGVVDTGVTKRVIFAADTARTAYSVVYLHGFSATRQETAPLSEQVAASLGANLFETRLTGHGLPGDSMGGVSARQWFEDAAEALRIGQLLGDSVIVIGTSTGGTLAVWLTSLAPAERRGLRRVVLISPNFGPRDPAAGVLTLPWASVVLPRFIPSREWTARNEAQLRYWTVRYPSTALFPMQAMVEFVRARDVSSYDVPTLILLNDADEVVDANATQRWVSRVSQTDAARVEVVHITPKADEDGHVLAGAIVAPSRTTEFRDRIVAFVR
jgi:esterase/lipase